MERARNVYNIRANDWRTTPYDRITKKYIIII
jgi:hypothetical protein